MDDLTNLDPEPVQVFIHVLDGHDPKTIAAYCGTVRVFVAWLATLLCVCTIAITAGYILWRLGSVFFGPLVEEWAGLGDAIWRERIAVGLLAAATLLIGVVPNVVADMSASGVAPIAARLVGLGS